MADAQQVLRLTVEEAALLANSGGSLDEIRPLIVMARKWLHSTTGEVADAEVRKCGLHGAALTQLGLA